MIPTDEIKKMREGGKSDSEIYSEMKRSGYPEKEITESLAQARIKQAVSSGEAEAPYPSQEEVSSDYQQEQNDKSQAGENYSSMEPSMLPAETEQPQYPQYEAQPHEYQSYSYPQTSQQNYSQYQPYQEAVNTDIITEIAEQVAAEKIDILRDKIEESISFKTITETNLSDLNERLGRMEKIINALQLSILKRVGEYVSDVKDIKTEMEETQKSFKTLIHAGKHHKQEHHRAAHHAK